MATYEIKSKRHHAVVRRKGYKRVSKSWPTKTEARIWAEDVELQMRNGTWIEAYKQKEINLSDIIQWSLDEAQTIKSFGKPKISAMNRCQEEVGHLTLDELTVETVMNYARAKRLGFEGRAPIKASTLDQHFSFISAAIKRAKKIQKIALVDNPFEDARDLLQQEKLVGPSEERDRRPTEEELYLITKMPDAWLRSYCLVALDSAMRQGEIHKLNPKDLDFETPHLTGKGLITIRGRKDKSTDAGKTMVIPMFEPTREVLLREYEWSVGSNVPVTNHTIMDSPKLAGSISDTWAKFAKKSLPPAEDRLRFHDFRHEAISRLFEADWDIPDVAAVSGHRDWSQLKRYTNLKPTQIGKKISS